MKPTHIEHIGIAVKSLETAIPVYEKLFGLSCYAIEEVAEQKVKTAFFKVGQTKIELLESTDPEGPIGRITSYNVCYTKLLRNRANQVYFQHFFEYYLHNHADLWIAAHRFHFLIIIQNNLMPH